MLKVLKNNLGLLKYLMVAIIGVIINLVVSEVLQNQFGFGFTTSLALGYLCGMVFGFFATRAFAFNSRAPYSIRREAIKYLMVSFTALFITSITGTTVLIVITWAIDNYPNGYKLWFNIINELPLPPNFINRNLISRIGGIGFGFFVNYFGHRFFTFRNTGTINLIKTKQAEIIARKK
jgi:putative flippase GtrA